MKKAVGAKLESIPKKIRIVQRAFDVCGPLQAQVKNPPSVSTLLGKRDVVLAPVVLNLRVGDRSKLTFVRILP
jgi:hypothetical protein